jgi:SAM-dependent methyltransferase
MDRNWRKKMQLSAIAHAQQHPQSTPPDQVERGCPVCGMDQMTTFIEMPRMPAHCNLLWKTQHEARQAPQGTIRLGFCHHCGHIFNLAFEPALMEYTQQYENSLHFSPRFQQYAHELATRLIARYDLHHKAVVEIGSGKGEFLRLLCELGDNTGTGFDPSYVPDPEVDEQDGRVTFVQDFYSERYTTYSADLICCRHVLEHIQHPRDFITNVRQAVGPRHDTVVFFEMPNALFMLRDLSIWDIIYEHCSYFSAGSLAYLFRACGFRAHYLTEEFGKQFLSIEAVPVVDAVDAPAAPVEPWDGLAALAHDVERFADNYRQKVITWEHKLADMARTGQRAVLWGAGSKGVTFLNTVQGREQIEYVVDINPRKQGMFVAGSGQRIVPPDFLRDYQPDIVIVMNPLYIGEIQQAIHALGLQSQVVAV